MMLASDQPAIRIISFKKVVEVSKHENEIQKQRLLKPALLMLPEWQEKMYKNNLDEKGSIYN